ncbi:MAG: hypothetical protein K0S22_484 [Oscillospiraceae bacterium]|nr:hypothetical protein [Oscillospiraceae bacterium]
MIPAAAFRRIFLRQRASEMNQTCLMLRAGYFYREGDRL